VNTKKPTSQINNRLYPLISFDHRPLCSASLGRADSAMVRISALLRWSGNR
jgi:hypothetical protein